MEWHNADLRNFYNRMDEFYNVEYSEIFKRLPFDEAVDICIRIGKQKVNNDIDRYVSFRRSFDMLMNLGVWTGNTLMEERHPDGEWFMPAWPDKYDSEKSSWMATDEMGQMAPIEPVDWKRNIMVADELGVCLVNVCHNDTVISLEYALRAAAEAGKGLVIIQGRKSGLTAAIAKEKDRLMDVVKEPSSELLKQIELTLAYKAKFDECYIPTPKKKAKKSVKQKFNDRIYNKKFGK